MEKPLFRFDNAKSQMSRCRCCGNVIAFQALRVGVTDYNEWRMDSEKGMGGGWNHIDCFFRKSPYLWWMREHTDTVHWLEGYNKLSSSDQSKVDNHMDKLRTRQIKRPVATDSDNDPWEDRFPAAGGLARTPGKQQATKKRKQTEKDGPPKKKLCDRGDEGSKVNGKPSSSAAKPEAGSSRTSEKVTDSGSAAKTSDESSGNDVTVSSRQIHNDKFVTFILSQAMGFRVSLLKTTAPPRRARGRGRGGGRPAAPPKLPEVDKDSGISLSQEEWHALLDDATVTLVNKLIGSDDNPLTDLEKEKLGLEDEDKVRRTKKNVRKGSKKSNLIPLSETVKIQVVTIPRQKLVDIRKYEGETSTKKGISLDKAEWEVFVGHKRVYEEEETSLLSNE